MIRDAQGKKNSPLDEFLKMTGPLIGIVPPNDYFSVLGWQMSFSADGQMVLARNQNINLASLNHDLLTTNLSVEDIVNVCYQNGYVVGDGITKLAAFGQSTLTMACSVRNEVLSDMNIDELLALLGGSEGNVADSDEKASSDTNNSVGLADCVDENPVMTTKPDFDPQVALGNQSFESNEPLDSFFQDDSLLPAFNPYMGSDFNAYNISHFHTTPENEFDFSGFF